MRLFKDNYMAEKYYQGEIEYNLHHRLLDGDVTASSEIAERLLFRVIEQLRSRYPNLDDQHLVDTAVHEAFMAYFLHPEKFNPAKSSLVNYLLMSAEGDLRNLLSKKRLSTVSLEAIQESGLGEKTLPSEDSAEEQLGSFSETEQWLRQRIVDPLDLTVINLLAENVRETQSYAEALNIQHLPLAEQKIRVKRHKDRLKKKLRRWWQYTHFGDYD
jgi:RNA polymerase sigma-70 factor, ECF subfamily